MIKVVPRFFITCWGDENSPEGERGRCFLGQRLYHHKGAFDEDHDYHDNDGDGEGDDRDVSSWSKTLSPLSFWDWFSSGWWWKYSRSWDESLSYDDQKYIVIMIPSLSTQGDFVLCVKEGKRVSHYIINREEQGYRIGEMLQNIINQNEKMQFTDQHEQRRAGQ